MKKLESESPTIKQILDTLDVELQKAVDATKERFVNKVVMGYRSFQYKSQKNSIIDFANCLNPILSIYKELLNLSKIDSESLMKLFDLFTMNEQQIKNELKIRYFKERNIKVPDFPFKLSALVEAYEFPDDHLDLIETIYSAIDEGRDILAHKEFEKYHRYFDGKQFAFSEADDKELISKHTVYADEDQLFEIMALHLFCTGLTNLKPDEYSFKSLPEIPAYIMGLIKIDTKLSREVGVSVNVDKINNPDGKMASFGINQSPNGGMSIRILSKD